MSLSFIFLFISYLNYSTISKDVVANDADRARNGYFYKMATKQECKVINHFNPIGYFISGIIKGITTARQGLAIFGISHIVVVEYGHIIIVLLNGATIVMGFLHLDFQSLGVFTE